MPEETTLSTAQCIAAMDSMLERAAVANAEPYRPRKSAPATKRRSARGRPQTAATRRKLKEKQRLSHAERARQAGNLSPIRAARQDAGLTLNDAAAKALISARSLRRAESDPRSVSGLTLARIGAALALRPSELLRD